MHARGQASEQHGTQKDLKPPGLSRGPRVGVPGPRREPPPSQGERGSARSSYGLRPEQPGPEKEPVSSGRDLHLCPVH